MVPVALVREDVIDHAIYFRFSPSLYHTDGEGAKGHPGGSPGGPGGPGGARGPGGREPCGQKERQDHQRK